MLGKTLSEKGINFNDLEKEIFGMGCEMARNTLATVLTVMDKGLAESRDKGKLRHKGYKATSF